MRSQDDRLNNYQVYHHANFGEESTYAIPDNVFFDQTRNTPNPRCPNSSSVPPHSSPTRPYNPGAEQGLRLLNPSGNAYQPSSFAQYVEQASNVPSYHGPWSNPNPANRYSYNDQTSSQIGVHSGPATGGSTCFKRTVHGTSQCPQNWPQDPTIPHGNPNYHGPGQPRCQIGGPNGQDPQYDRPSHMVPSSRRIRELPRTLGSYNLPIDTAPAASLKRNPGIWNQRPPRGIDRSRIIPENHTAALRSPFGERNVYENPGEAFTVPVLEKSKSTSSCPRINALRPTYSLKEAQFQEKVQTPKPTTAKPRKQRVLTEAGRDHAKAIRQLPGGACEDCKKKKTKARCSYGAV